MRAPVKVSVWAYFSFLEGLGFIVEGLRCRVQSLKLRVLASEI